MNQLDNEQPPGSTNAVTPPATPSTPAPPTTPSTPPPVSIPTPQFSTNIPMKESEPAPSTQTVPPSAVNTNDTAMTVPPSVLNTNETEQYPVNPAMAPLPPPQAEAPSMPEMAMPAHPEQIPTSGAQTNPGAQQPSPVTVSGPGTNGSSLSNEPKTTNAAPAFEQITAPPLPISQQQQAELQSLLSQYLANQITPAQYQEQRARILAQP
jgi:hypothetical protein